MRARRQAGEVEKERRSSSPALLLLLLLLLRLLTLVAALRFAEKRPVVFAAVCSIGDRAEREVRVRIRLMDLIVDAIVVVVFGRDGEGEGWCTEFSGV